MMVRRRRRPSRPSPSSAVPTTLLVVVFTILGGSSPNGSAHAALTLASELTHPTLSGAGGIDAHGSIAYVAGDGVTAIDVTDPDAPKVLMTLTDPLLSRCKSVYAYTTSAQDADGAGAGANNAKNAKKRLAVACSGSDALVLVDADTPGDLKTLGAVAEPVALKGAAGVVVKGTLAFVAASGVARVVSVDVRRETNPAVLSSVRLSAASTVALHGEAKSPFVRPFVRSFVRSFVHSFIHSFTRSLALQHGRGSTPRDVRTHGFIHGKKYTVRRWR